MEATGVTSVGGGSTYSLPRRRTPALRSAEFTDYVDMVEACLVHLGADLTGWQDEAVA